jgi:adenylyltransferase/sulfurtransferase
MDDRELERYSRQMILPDWGAEGQLALRGASALIVGAGGLGSPAAMYLAAAGTGKLVIVDDDAVELVNLQRQILHGESGLGRPKTESGADRLRDLNPLADTRTVQERLTAENAESLVDEADIVLDGSDNFDTRYAVNAACVSRHKPLVTGSVIRWEGQVTVLRPDKGGPCYACLFPPDAESREEACAEAGIVAPLPGIIGSIQALEATKVIAGLGESLEGRLLTLDARTMRWTERGYRRDPGCPVCGFSESN